jgi:Zn-dependent M28 family amino/carboxypeptidase
MSRRKKFFVVLLVLVLLPMLVYFYEVIRYPGEGKELAQQRKEVAALKRHPLPAVLDHAQIIADDQTLSSDAFEGREAGTPGGHKTQAYVAARFREIGLNSFTPDYRQPFTRHQRSRLHQWIFGKDSIAPNDSANVLGYLRGTRVPDEYIVVSAHFDHLGKRGKSIYHGADDNASGTAALLAIAKYFASHPPEHSMIFAAFDAEEKGLQGAKYFVKNPPAPIDQVVLNVNMDMVGRNVRNEIFATGTYQEPELRPLIAPLQSQTSLTFLFGHDYPLPFWNVEDDWTDQSDQGAFMDADIPAIYIGVDATKDYHRPTDTFDKIDQKFLVNAAELVADLVVRLDQTEELPD